MMTTLQLATPPPLSPATVNAVFPRVLLAIDFGSASLAAARWATTHVVPDTEAVLTHVMPFTDDSVCADVSALSERESIHRMTPALVGGLGGFAATLDVAGFRNVVRLGRPSGCLAGIAGETGADLVVLGRRGDANRIRVGEPNVIERTARRTSASVLVVPEGTNSAARHVVAAVDESRFAPHVLRVAGWLARMHEIPLTVLHVLSPAVGAYERVIRSAKHLVSGTRGKRMKVPLTVHSSPASSTTRWLAQLGRAHSVPGREVTDVALGDPAREIVRTSIERGPSLVVVGMRGADEAPPGSIGSVARELLTRGPMPVLAVNPR